MRSLWRSPSGILRGAALLCACNNSPAGLPAALIIPSPGRYQSTLAAYEIQTCDAALTPQVGVLDTTIEFGYPMGDTVSLYGGEGWIFGSVTLTPGSPIGLTADLAPLVVWQGSATAQTQMSGCMLTATLSAAYNPSDTRDGTLYLDESYRGAAPCALTLPCENRARWTLTQP